MIFFSRLTGYLMMKVGKMAAVALGGGIILLQVANHNGFIKVNWDRLYKKANEVGDQLETTATSKGPKLMDKVSNINFILLLEFVKCVTFE